MITRILLEDREINSMCCNIDLLVRGNITTPASRVISESILEVRFIISDRSPSGARPRAICSTSADCRLFIRNRLSTNSRYPLAVGTRPAEVWGDCNNPRSSRSAITLRIVAGLRFRSESLASVREPTGWPSSIKCSTKTLKRRRLRSESWEGSRLETMIKISRSKYYKGI